MDEEVDETKKAQSEEIATVSKQLKIMDLELKKQKVGMDMRIVYLGVVDMEQYTWMNDITVSRLAAKLRSCHPPPWKNSEKPAIIKYYVSKTEKQALLRLRQKLRGSNIYVNEHLTKKNADMLPEDIKQNPTWTKCS